MNKEKQAYQSILNEIEKHRRKYGMENLWFRGEGKLYPTMGSTMARTILTHEGELVSRIRFSYQQKRNIMVYEKWIYEHFVPFIQSEAPDGYVLQPLHDWDIVYYLQHYGIPTRFLDWSRSIDVALYFAAAGDKDGENAILWLLNPEKFNELTRGEREIKVAKRGAYKQFLNQSVSMSRPEMVAITPESYPPANDRLPRQQGTFVFTGLEYTDLRYMVNTLSEEKQWDNEEILNKIEVPYSSLQLAYAFIKDRVNEQSLGLRDGDHLKERFGLNAFLHR
ncbi:FRG domain-containing protein [Peribacillus frigoritolerans]|uniref:FRG domain-containing protein n=1 Tax=Peribacillus frigoritolerans TaxID=450367 RepID=A0AAJ1QM18_9BACI|nr:FRG domain-containing protein [Peribacillus frigoritolerans]MDM5283802.1 FRG domain-containing protein [Peribacillus frigoritolerans]